MKLHTLLTVGAIAALAAFPAMAADISAHDPQGVLKALGTLGYQAELKTGTDGNSSIAMTIDGSPSYVDFWNCDDDKTNCETLMLVYGMDLKDGTTAEKANEWNFDTIHGFVYVDKDMDPWLNLTIATGADGIPDSLFADIMKVWRTRVGDVRKFFDM